VKIVFHPILLKLLAWRPWRVQGSMRRFALVWMLLLLLGTEVLQWAWMDGEGVAWSAQAGVWWVVKLVLWCLGLWLVLRQTFAPVMALSQSLADRDAGDLQLVSRRQPQELAPLTVAVNLLLQQQQASLDQQRKFLADASHQLRTPFAVLRTQLQGVMSGELETRATLPKMLGTVDRASDLVRQLLALAKVEQLVRGANWREVALDAVAQDVVMEFAPLFARKKLDFSLEAVPVRLLTDPWLLGELVRNLLSNAIQHTPRGGALGLVVRVMPSGPELLVWDNGGGMNEAVQARLFEPFQSSSGATGVGLGLSICRQIAVSMDAVVELFNRVQDDRIVGVDAVVRWPREMATVAGPNAEQAPSAAHPGRSSEPPPFVNGSIPSSPVASREPRP